MTFVTYVHFRADGAPFYVGKGSPKRARHLAPKLRNKHHGSIVAKDGAENIKVAVYPCSSEKAAFSLERVLVAAYRREGAVLVNLTAGGDGPAGMKHSEETRRQLAALATGKKKSAGTLAKLSASLKGHLVSEETRALLSLRRKGAVFGPEARANMSAAHKGKPPTPAALRVLAEYRGKAWPKGSRHTEETRRKMSESGRGRTNALGHRLSSEVKARLAAVQLGKTYPKVSCPACHGLVSITQIKNHLRAYHSGDRDGV